MALFYSARFFNCFMLIYPLYTIVFHVCGMSEEATGRLLAIWSLSVIVLAVPAGFLLDRMKRKNVLILAMAAKVLTDSAAWPLPSSMAAVVECDMLRSQCNARRADRNPDTAVHRVKQEGLGYYTSMKLKNR